MYAIFGWSAAAFVLITFANLAKFIGLGLWVNAVGNLMFLSLTVFTIVVAFLAWRRGNRAAGWFMIAWALLEGFTMTAAMLFLATGSVDSSPLLYYYGLPLSMAAGAVLIALGVADRLRAQRLALTETERRAQTDPLTGVLNRRSLIERLEAACLRAIIDPIHAELRQSDVIGRYGGEEFVVILSSADAAAAGPIAQRILERMAAVYAAKRLGRNRVHMAASLAA